MGILNLTVVSGRSVDELEKLQIPGGNHEIAQKLKNYIEGLTTGSEKAYGVGAPPSITIAVQEEAVQASGTFTLDTVVATDAVSINGVSFTAVASGAGANQFDVGADDTETAANLAASINASVSALVDGYVTASSAAEVVTVTSAFYGIAGNQTLIASADVTIVASGARLTGGAADPDALTISF